MDFLTAFLLLFIVGAVLGDIKISPSAHETEQYVNGTYVVTCHGDDTENTTWKGPDGKIISPGNGRIHVEETITYRGHHAVLVFEKIERQDRGKYTCTSTVRDQLQQVSFNLSVVRPITFVGHQSLQKLVEGQNMLIRCEVQGEPEPIISWMFHGKPIHTRTEHSGSSRFLKMPRGLFITNVSRDDEGSYLCRAFQLTTKSSNFESIHIFVTVLQKPRWPDNMWKSDYSYEVTYGYIGGIANITCHAEGRPAPGYAWTRRNKTIDSSYGHVIHEENQSVLQVKMVDHRVLGDYECVADNGVGKIWKRFTLMEGRKPSPPHRVRLLTVTRDGARIEIESSNDRDIVLGYRIQFMKVRNFGFNEPWAWEYPEYQDVIFSHEPYKLIELVPRTDYKFRVATKSIAGLSDFTHEYRFTTSSGTHQKISVIFIILTFLFVKIY